MPEFHHVLELHEGLKRIPSHLLFISNRLKIIVLDELLLYSQIFHCQEFEDQMEVYPLHVLLAAQEASFQDLRR